LILLEERKLGRLGDVNKRGIGFQPVISRGIGFQPVIHGGDRFSAFSTCSNAERVEKSLDVSDAERTG
jgi:hypothetical protein